MIVIPTTFPEPDRLGYTSGAIIEGVGVTDIAEGSHLSWVYTGDLAPVQAFDPIWQTTSDTLTKNGGADATPLYYWPGNICPRPVVVSDAAKIAITLSAWLLNCELEIDIYSSAGGSDTLTVSTTATTWTHVTDTIFVDPSDYLVSGRLDYVCSDIGAKRGAASGTAGLAQFAIHSYIGVAANIPRGR